MFKAFVSRTETELDLYQINQSSTAQVVTWKHITWVRISMTGLSLVPVLIQPWFKVLSHINQAHNFCVHCLTFSLLKPKYGKLNHSVVGTPGASRHRHKGSTCSVLLISIYPDLQERDILQLCSEYITPEHACVCPTLVREFKT